MAKEYEGMSFSESDEEEYGNVDSVKEQVTYRLQENTNALFRALKDFLSTPSFINSKGDESTNIVDLFNKKCYCIPDKKIPKLMKFLEISRRKKLKMMIYEKQALYSGIMLDFDFKLNHGGEIPIIDSHYYRLCIAVVKILAKFLHFPEDMVGTHQNVHIGFIRKPKILYDSDNEYYKYGIHMLIPGIQITREFKKLIINTIDSENLLDKVFKDIVPHSSITKNDFLDKNSAHVGVFFIGSASKINSPAYEFDSAYKVQFTVGESDDDVIPVKISDFTADQNVNLVYEFSLNWAKAKDKNGIIEKKRYDIKPSFAHLLTPCENKEFDLDYDDETEANYNEMSILNMHDVDATYIKTLLDILHPKRSEDYSLWFDVLCALAHTSPSYKTLGEYFSRKSPEKFDVGKFEQTWNSILIKKTNKLSLGSLHFWAKSDNPDRYEEVKHRSIFNLLYKKIYDPTIEGNLEHYDVAEVLYTVLKDKYIFDRYNEEGGSWYEFILENEPMKPGEMYKWRKYDGKVPNSFLKYMSTILPNLFRKILDRIKTTLEESTEELAKYHYTIYKNFQKSCRNLKNSGFKQSSSRESEQLFEKMGFSSSLDSDPSLKGVANGILQLGKECKLITGYHGHLVSKYTSAKYIKFNPHDPMTTKVLTALRNLFPDCEPDTFNYIMHYLASTLDGHKKESIFLILVGKGSNGKSFLVELHKGAIGEIYGVKMPLSFLTSRSKDAESATPALMQLKDAHFCYYSESNKFEVLNMAKIKEFTGQETMAGRKLHQDYVNFKPKCHHLVASNNDFEVLGTDHGTWRRIDYMTMKIKFCNVSTDKYDQSNPYERIADPTLGSKWAEDPEVLAHYLGILAYYYESLHNKYDGKVRNVPHPHIIKETEEFRNRQDRVNNFLNTSLVKTPDEDYEMPMPTVRDRYIKWHESAYPGTSKEYQRLAVDQLENSKIQTFIKKTKRGNFLKGYRILDITEEAEDGEEYYIDLFEKANQDVEGIRKETAEELIIRLRKEYDTNPINKNTDNVIIHREVKLDESDSDIDDIIESTAKREPKKMQMLEKKPINVDSNGIRLPPARKGILHNVEILKEYASMGNNLESDDSE